MNMDIYSLKIKAHIIKVWAIRDLKAGSLLKLSYWVWFFCPFSAALVGHC